MYAMIEPSLARPELFWTGPAGRGRKCQPPATPRLSCARWAGQPRTAPTRRP